MQMKKHEKLCGRDEAGVGRGVESMTNLVSISGGEGKCLQTSGSAKAKGLKAKYVFNVRGWSETPLDP